MKLDTISDEQKVFKDYMKDKKCALVVNVASLWPFAPWHYENMVQMYDKYEK